MKLPAGPARLLFFVSFLAHTRCEDVFGILGENFTFPVKIDQKLEEIIWKKNKDKVAEWEEQSNTTYFTSLWNRALLNTENGCLTIFNLEESDAGTYALEYFDSEKTNNELIFMLAVLAAPSEPEISCNISGDYLVLKCTTDYQKPLSYTWKLNNVPMADQTQEISIPKKNIDASGKAVCLIQLSQMEKSSEISLTQCFLGEKGDSHRKRSRPGLIVAFILFFIVSGTLVYQYKREKANTGKGMASQNNPAHVPAERQPLRLVESEEQVSRGTSSQAVDYGSENPEAEHSAVQNNQQCS